MGAVVLRRLSSSTAGANGSLSVRVDGAERARPLAPHLREVERAAEAQSCVARRGVSSAGRQTRAGLREATDRRELLPAAVRVRAQALLRAVQPTLRGGCVHQ